MPQASVSSSFDTIIDRSSPSTINADVIAEADLDADDNLDHFAESKGLSCEDFCKSINDAVTGVSIYNIVYENLPRGNKAKDMSLTMGRIIKAMKSKNVNLKDDSFKSYSNLKESEKSELKSALTSIDASTCSSQLDIVKNAVLSVFITPGKKNCVTSGATNDSNAHGSTKEVSTNTYLNKVALLAHLLIDPMCASILSEIHSTVPEVNRTALLDTSGQNAGEKFSERVQLCFNKFVGARGRNKNVAVFYWFCTWEGQPPRLGSTRKLSAISTDEAGTAKPTSNIPRSLRNVQQALQNMLPTKMTDEVDLKTKKCKQEYYEAKTRSENVASLQLFINSAGFRHLCKTEQEQIHKQMHELLGLKLLSDACMDVTDV